MTLCVENIRLLCGDISGYLDSEYANNEFENHGEFEERLKIGKQMMEARKEQFLAHCKQSRVLSRSKAKVSVSRV